MPCIYVAKVFTNMYNSAGASEFSTLLKMVTLLSNEQGASPPVQRSTSRRASPSSSRGLRPREEDDVFPPVALASAVIA